MKTFVSIDGRDIAVIVKGVAMYRDVLIAKVRAKHDKPFTGNGIPTRFADFELSLVKVRMIDISLQGYIQNGTNLNPA